MVTVKGYKSSATILYKKNTGIQHDSEYIKIYTFLPFRKVWHDIVERGLLAGRKGGSVAVQGGDFLEKGGSAREKGGTICSDGLVGNMADKSKC